MALTALSSLPCFTEFCQELYEKTKKEEVSKCYREESLRGGTVKTPGMCRYRLRNLCIRRGILLPKRVRRWTDICKECTDT